MSKKEERIGIKKYNNSGEIMEIVDYNSATDMTIMFYDENKTIKEHVTWNDFKNGKIRNLSNYKQRLYTESVNNQGCKMKVIEYKSSHNIIVEFQDKYKFTIKTKWNHFINGDIKNPYHPTVCGIGALGTKYAKSIRGKHTKEYMTWFAMIQRCYDSKTKEKHPTYQDVTCCKEWLLFENFYEWLHGQENFDKWKDMELSAIDKDILVKGNKIYSPDTCCLVPNYVNMLFVRQNTQRGDLPIGVSSCKDKFISQVSTRDGLIISKIRNTLEESFIDYKIKKENLIKQIAQEEYDKGNINKKCYDAMMNYEVEITD